MHDILETRHQTRLRTRFSTSDGPFPNVTGILGPEEHSYVSYFNQPAPNPSNVAKSAKKWLRSKANSFEDGNECQLHFHEGIIQWTAHNFPFLHSKFLKKNICSSLINHSAKPPLSFVPRPTPKTFLFHPKRPKYRCLFLTATRKAAQEKKKEKIMQASSRKLERMP